MSIISQIYSIFYIKFDKFMDDIYDTYFNKYDVNPYGYCPVQAEGYLSTGEYYYFRSRDTNWTVYISKNEKELFTNSWKYGEEKYKEYLGGYIPKREVIKNFNKAVKKYYVDEHTRSRENTSEVFQRGVQRQTQTDTRKNVDKSD